MLLEPSFAVVIDAWFTGDPREPWMRGPLPVGDAAVGVVADEPSRRSYFAPRVADALFGTTQDQRRWHFEPQDAAFAPVAPEGLSLTAVELQLMDAPGPGPRRAQVILHLQATQSLEQALDAMYLAFRDRRGRTNTLDVLQAAASDVGLSVEHGAGPSKVFIVSWADHEDIDDAVAHLFGLTTTTGRPRFELDPVQRKEVEKDQIEISADWRCLVMRDGAGFCMSRTSDFAPSARIYAQTIYLDVLLLARIESRLLDAAAHEVVLLAARDGHDLGVLADSQSRLLRFRVNFWWTSVCDSWLGNALLASYQRQHASAEQLEEITYELQALARIATSEATARAEVAARRTNAGLGLLAVVGMPLSASLAVWQVVDGSWFGLAWVLGSCLVFVALVLLASSGMRSLFSGLKDDQPKRSA